MASLCSSGGDRLLSVLEIAKRLGVCRRTLERLVSQGEFPLPVKVGSKSLYFESDLDAYLAKLRQRREGGRAA